MVGDNYMRDSFWGDLGESYMNEMYKKAAISKYANKSLDQKKVEELLKMAMTASAAGNNKVISSAAKDFMFHK